jgi:hypothetical protein
VIESNLKVQQVLGRLEDVVQQPLDGSADLVANLANEQEQK